MSKVRQKDKQSVIQTKTKIRRENVKGQFYLGIGDILVSRNVPKMSAISLAVFFETEDGHDD